MSTATITSDGTNARTGQANTPKKAPAEKGSGSGQKGSGENVG